MIHLLQETKIYHQNSGYGQRSAVIPDPLLMLHVTQVNDQVALW